MSSLRAFALPTQAIPQPADTQPLRPRVGPRAPERCEDVDRTIHVLARLGSGPLPTAVLVTALVIGLTLRG